VINRWSGDAIDIIGATASRRSAIAASAPTRPARRSRVFHDFDRDGVKDAGDSGLSAWMVYIDLDNDKILDTNEARVLTDAGGSCTIGNLGAGTFKARAVIQTATCRRRSPTDSDTASR
jgi:hypothetical protein